MQSNIVLYQNWLTLQLDSINSLHCRSTSAYSCITAVFDKSDAVSSPSSWCFAGRHRTFCQTDSKPSPKRPFLYDTRECSDINIQSLSWAGSFIMSLRGRTLNCSQFRALPAITTFNPILLHSYSIEIFKIGTSSIR